MKVRQGEYVAEFIDDGDIDSERIQPHGVDLTIDSIYRIEDTPTLTDDDYYKGERIEIVTDNDGFYTLGKMPYIVVYDEKIQIPYDCVGYVMPRSRLPRSGVFLTSALWDAGYEGQGEGLIMPMHNAHIHEDMAIGQMVFYSAEDPQTTYEGSHQGERL